MMNPFQKPGSLFWLVLAAVLLAAAPPLAALFWTTTTSSAETPAPIATTIMTLAATVVIAVAVAWMAVRTLRLFDRRLRQLGAGEFDQPIAIRGPQDLEALGERLEWLRRRLSQLENQKLDFVRHISHELKTPLTTIREGSELLLDEGGQRLDPESAEIAEIMRDSALALEKLITDLLQFGRTVSPARALPEYEQVDLAQLSRTVLGQHAIASYAKRLGIDTDLRPASLWGHREQLLTVIDNLVSNAIKYTPEEGLIRVATSQDDQGVLISVRDSGPGIQAEESDNIFEPFFRGSAPVRSHVKGTGLGLSIAREYVEAHEGRIEVVPCDQGAHLCVRLPATTAVMDAGRESAA